VMTIMQTVELSSSLGVHGAWHGIFQIFEIMKNMCHCIIDASLGLNESHTHPAKYFFPQALNNLACWLYSVKLLKTAKSRSKLFSVSMMNHITFKE